MKVTKSTKVSDLSHGLLKASTVKVVAAPPANVIVCLPVVSEGKIIGQLQSELLTEDQAYDMAQAINKSLADD